jgi:HSP90 family molecular chaperone
LTVVGCRLERTVSKPETVPDPSQPLNADGAQPVKTVMNKVKEWYTINVKKPLWLRPAKTTTDAEYTEFYQQTFKTRDVPAAHAHFSVEGNVDFKALLYIPNEVHPELTRDMFANAARSMRLYVKRVFINDKFEDLLPRWLMFLRGVVDSDDFQLNVSREILQQTRSLRLIKQRLVKKAIDMFTELAATNRAAYDRFIHNFGRYLKVGVLEDEVNRVELVPLCRFLTSFRNSTDTSPNSKLGPRANDGDATTSLPEYIARMKPDQKHIYYAVGESLAQVSMSPSLERLKQKGYEVLYVTDPLDELTLQQISKVDEFPIMDIGKENTDLEELTEGEKKQKTSLNDEYVALRTWMKGVLGERVARVEMSTRLVESPATLVQSEYGLSPTMQKYIRAQQTMAAENKAQKAQNRQVGSATDKDEELNSLASNVAEEIQQEITSALFKQGVLEVNPTHPIIQRLKHMSATEPESILARDMVLLLFSNSALAAGYVLDNSVEYSHLVTKLMTAVAATAA